MKKKMLAWVLAAAVTLSSNSMVFAAEGDLFTDAPVQEQWAEADTDESIPEDNPGIDGTGSDGNETGDIKVNIPKSDSIFSNGEIEEGPVAFSDGEKNIFSSGQVMAEGGTSSFINDGAVTVTQTDTTFEVTADAEGNLDFKFNPGETGIYQFTIDEANIFTKENPAEIYSSGASTYKKMGNMFGINIVNVTSEENPCECRLSPVEPGKQYTLTWKKLKEVKKIEAQNIPDQFYKDGVIVGLDSWMREMQCLITYADDNSETIDYAVHEGQEYNLAYTYGIDPGYYHCFLLEGGPTEKYSFKLPISKNDVTKIGQEITLDQTLTQKELLPNYLGQYYCFYFTPSATGTYMIDTKNGRIDNAVNANTGEKISAGSNYNMTEGVTYAFTILPDDISTFAVTMKAAKSISKLEIINPESIPAKVLYGDSDFLRYTKFRITFADENSEELTVYTKSPSGYSLTYSSEHDSNGFIKKGDRQIAFHIGDNDDVEAVANVKVVDNIEELSIPTIQDGTVYNQDNFSPNYGDYYAGIFTAEMNGYFNIETSGLWCDMRDVDSMIPVYSQLFGYKVEAGHSYMMKVYPDSVENWQFKMLFTPEISVTTSTVVSKLNAAGKAKVVFKPTESGDYIIKLQEEAIKKDSEGQDCTTYSLYNGTNGEGGTSGQYSGSFEKDVTYQMTFSNLAEGFSEVSISLAQKKKVSKVEITSGLDEFQKTLVYEDPFASINFSALRFKITYEDSSTREGVKMYEAFSDDETDNYYIYPQYIERPSGYEGEILLLGEYKIGFILFNGFGSTAEMPEPIEVNVKHLSELTEDDFPVIEFGEKYTSTEWTPNYNGKYLFLFKPQYTGVYDLSEIYLNCDSLEVRPTFLEEYDWHTGLYVNGVGMEQGKTYGILLQPSSKPWDFTVYANEKVTGLELVDPNQINGMQVIGELYHSGLFQDLKFKIKYLDKKGQEQETESFHDFGSVIYPEDFVDRTIVTPGAIQAEFCLERMKGINQKYNVDVVSLKDVTDTLPEISENTVRTDLPDNYNNGKCFNFTPETDGAYTFSFGGESCFGAYAADGAFVKEWGGEHWRLDAKAGVTYSIFAKAWSGNSIPKVSVLSLTDLEKLEIVKGAGQTAKRLDGIGYYFPEGEVVCKYTTVDGETGTVKLGETSEKYGTLQMGYQNSGESNGTKLYYYFGLVPDVKSDVFETQEGSPKDIQAKELVLGQDVKIDNYVGYNPQSDEGGARDIWGASFTPSRTSDYLIDFGDNVFEVAVYYKEKDAAEYKFKDVCFSPLSMELTEGNTYLFLAEDMVLGDTVHGKITDKNASIVTEVPKVNPDTSTPPVTTQVGISTGNTKDEQSDVTKTEQTLNQIITDITKDSLDNEVKVTPITSNDPSQTLPVKEQIKAALESEGAEIVTKVQISSQETEVEKTEATSVKEAVKQSLESDVSGEPDLTVENKIDISVEINAKTIQDEEEQVTKIGNITELPEAKAIPVTVLLTQKQMQKKMLVAYNHNNEIYVIPEEKTSQKNGVLTFLTNQYSSYYLVSSAKGFTVTYEMTAPTGGTTETISGQSYSATAEDKQVSAAHYKFLGWYDKATGKEWNFSDPIKGDLTLVGHWEYISTPGTPITYYTVTFDSQDGSTVASQSMTYASKVKEPTAPTKENYTFEGWYKEASCETPWDFAKDTITGNLTLFAKWKEAEKEPIKIPAAPVLKGISAKKAYLKMSIAEKVEDVDGYEYAYSKAADWSTDNFVIWGDQAAEALSCESTKVPAGIYTGKVRSYKLEDSEKVYSAWSNGKWFEIPSSTLNAPEVVSVKVKGTTVTVTLKGDKRSVGYDCVLGIGRNTIKPINYAYIKKNKKTTTIVFKNVVKGTYYVGAHAYNPHKGKKLFSKWSNQKKITVK